MLHISAITDHPQAPNTWYLQLNIKCTYMEFVSHKFKIYMHFILKFKIMYLDDRRWSILLKHVACVDETIKIGCGSRYMTMSFNMYSTTTEWIPQILLKKV